VFSVGLPVAPLLRARIAPKQTFAATGSLSTRRRWNGTQPCGHSGRWSRPVL